jgi:hypothetical protein
MTLPNKGMLVDFIILALVETAYPRCVRHDEFAALRIRTDVAMARFCKTKKNNEKTTDKLIANARNEPRAIISRKYRGTKIATQMAQFRGSLTWNHFLAVNGVQRCVIYEAIV